MSAAREEKAPPRQAGGGTQRLMAKLSACLAAGNYYEAHQMYRTLHFRLLAKKSYDELLRALYAGASELLARGQQQSGIDVAALYADVLARAEAPCDERSVERVARLFAAMDGSVPERDNYLQAAIRWSKGGEHAQHGHPLLHKEIAFALWKEKNYPAAQVHFYNSDDGAALAGMLVEMHGKQGSPNDADLFVATAVLQILCKMKRQLARDTFVYYIGHHPDLLDRNRPPFDAELLNFVWFLLQAVDNGNADAFKELVAKFEPSIKRDPHYPDYLKKIGRIWFDIVPPKASSNGIFGNLIQNLLTGMEADDGAAEERANPASAQSRMQTEDVE